MDGTTLDCIIIPIVVMISLAAVTVPRQAAAVEADRAIVR